MADTLVERRASLSAMETQTAVTAKCQHTPVRTAQTPRSGGAKRCHGDPGPRTPGQWDVNTAHFLGKKSAESCELEHAFAV